MLNQDSRSNEKECVIESQCNEATVNGNWNISMEEESIFDEILCKIRHLMSRLRRNKLQNRQVICKRILSHLNNSISWKQDIITLFVRTASKCLSLSSFPSDGCSTLNSIEMLVLISWISHPWIFDKKVKLNWRNFYCAQCTN